MAIFGRSKGRARRQAHAWVARLQGQPSARDREKFERWYNAGRANAAAYDQLSVDWDQAYGRVAQTSIGRGRTGLPERKASVRPLGYALITVSLVGLLAAVLLLMRPGTESAAQAEIFATAIGEIRTVALPDQSRVTLDTGSRVAMRYRAEERRLELLEGRARFFVHPDADRPFVVEADGGEVIARATIFDVSLIPDGTTVALIEGEVEVQLTPSPGSPPVRRTLAPGERVVVHARGRLRDVLPASDAELRWPSGMLEFRNTALRAAVAEANRYSSTKILIEDPSVATLRVTGTFRAGDTGGLARSLATAFSLRLEEKADGDMVLLAR